MTLDWNLDLVLVLGLLAKNRGHSQVPGMQKSLEVQRRPAFVI